MQRAQHIVRSTARTRMHTHTLHSRTVATSRQALAPFLLCLIPLLPGFSPILMCGGHSPFFLCCGERDAAVPPRASGWLPFVQLRLPLSVQVQHFFATMHSVTRQCTMYINTQLLSVPGPICSDHPLMRTLRMNGSRKRSTAYDTWSYYFIKVAW